MAWFVYVLTLCRAVGIFYSLRKRYLFGVLCTRRVRIVYCGIPDFEPLYCLDDDLGARFVWAGRDS